MSEHATLICSAASAEVETVRLIASLDHRAVTVTKEVATTGKRHHRRLDDQKSRQLDHQVDKTDDTAGNSSRKASLVLQAIAAPTGRGSQQTSSRVASSSSSSSTIDDMLQDVSEEMGKQLERFELEALRRLRRDKERLLLAVIGLYDDLRKMDAFVSECLTVCTSTTAASSTSSLTSSSTAKSKTKIAGTANVKTSTRGTSDVTGSGGGNILLVLLASHRVQRVLASSFAMLPGDSDNNA